MEPQDCYLSALLEKHKTFPNVGKLWISSVTSLIFTDSIYILSLLPKQVHFFSVEFWWEISQYIPFNYSLYSKAMRLGCWLKFDQHYYAMSLVFLDKPGIRYTILIKEKYLAKVKRVYSQKIFRGRNTISTSQNGYQSLHSLSRH